MYYSVNKLARVDPLEVLRAAFRVVDVKGAVGFYPDGFSSHEAEFKTAVLRKSHDFLQNKTMRAGRKSKRKFHVCGLQQVYSVGLPPTIVIA